MNEHLEEIYTKDGKSLSELIEDWIDENNFFLYCKYKDKQAKIFIDK
ncbi:MAG: hypothetical protein Q4G09_05565 [Clostridia bacterium]|nr:hypothetical protein [Clostridia bacterium]